MNQVAIGYLFQEQITKFLYLIHLESVIYIKIFMKFIKISILLQMNIGFSI